MPLKRSFALTRIALLTAFALLLSCSLSLAAEFSADTVETRGGKTYKGKLYVKGSKMRREGVIEGRNSTMILRMDKGIMWSLMPEDKTYIEVGNVASSDAEEMEKAAKDIADKRELGTEMLNGYLCNKVQYIYHDKRMGVLTMWIAKELNHAIKMETTGAAGHSFKSELTNIKVHSAPDSLFEIPKGYTKMSAPDMPKSPGRPRR